MTLNYKEEKIPSCKELNDFAEDMLNKISVAQPVEVLGNFIDKKTKKYLGQEYFKEIEKNTAIGYTKINNDFSGLYVFYNTDTVAYVGISNSIIRRLRSHFISNSRTQSGLVYLIAKNMYENEKKKLYVGLRDDFPFEKYRKKIQKEIVNKWKIKVLKIENGYNLSYSEIYIASSLESFWNCFKPH